MTDCCEREYHREKEGHSVTLSRRVVVRQNFMYIEQKPRSAHTCLYPSIHPSIHPFLLCSQTVFRDIVSTELLLQPTRYLSYNSYKQPHKIQFSTFPRHEILSFRPIMLWRLFLDGADTLHFYDNDVRGRSCRNGSHVDSQRTRCAK